MVSSIDHLSNMFSERAGLVEALLLHFLTIRELSRVASLSKTIRRLFDPNSNHHLNFVKTFSERLFIESNDPDYVSFLPLNDAKTWIQVLELAEIQFAKLRLAPVQRLGNTYKRFDPKYQTIEFLSYAGGCSPTWSDTPSYYAPSGTCAGVTFSRPCLVLKEVCWLDAWAIIEQVKVP